MTFLHSLLATAFSAGKKQDFRLFQERAAELGSRNITVNSVLPGTVETERQEVLTPEQREMFVQMTPLTRIGQPDDIADVGRLSVQR